ncbi:MAG: SufD family Fe-S cluster assembly protein [Gammaproteobacteria bacterium]|nr:SufD family Fe-S cluster assembly protein [Gammaproteobacteria bacterium]
MTTSETSTLIPSFAPWLNRTEAQSVLDELGLPRYRSEPWKYTNPQPLIDEIANFVEVDGDTITSLDDEIEVCSLSSPRAKSLAKTKLGSSVEREQYSPMLALNLVNLTGGFLIRAEPNDRSSTPLVTIEPAMNRCERFIVIVESGATLQLEETCDGGNRVFECLIEEGATLIHKRFQKPSETVEYGHICVQVGTNSSYRLDQFSTGAALRRNEIVVDIQGEGARVSVEGGWRLMDQTHVDSQISVNHLAPRSESGMKFHGVVGGRSRAVFNGRIHIARDAQHTSAHLTNKNILTSDTAEVYTKPELEIYADDVACSHGATSGQLDEDQLLYMRTRGISKNRSREMLLKGFLNEVVTDTAGSRLLGVSNTAQP